MGLAGPLVRLPLPLCVPEHDSAFAAVKGKTV
jgi:hypothetical protein